MGFHTCGALVDSNQVVCFRHLTTPKVIKALNLPLKKFVGSLLLQRYVFEGDEIIARG